MKKQKVSQNIQDLISEIGERMVLFKLYELIHGNKNFEIFKNYSDSGYDIGIKNNSSGVKIKIEVKTRQHLITTTKEKNKNSCHFTLTENECKSADYLIGYWLEYNDFFIVPVNKLNVSKNGTKKVYKHIVTRLKKAKTERTIYSEASMEFLNDNGWETIKKLVANKN